MTGKQNFHARLENQKAQLERHGNFAEVVIRTTPEATDIINAARLWEHILLTADRKTRGYVAKQSRDEFDDTRKDFEDAMAYMMQKMRDAVKRHDIDLSGNNFVSRIAQRYGLSEKTRSSKPRKPKADEAPAQQTAAAQPASAAPAAAPVQPAPVAAAPAQARPIQPQQPQQPQQAAPKVVPDSVDGF